MQFSYRGKELMILVITSNQKKTISKSHKKRLGLYVFQTTRSV